MIFSYCYDRSLWLMLQSKGFERGQIVDFIKGLTDEMHECIRTLIDDYYSDENRLVSHRQLVGKNFSFRVEIIDDELIIKLHKWNMDGINVLDEIFQISLEPLCYDLLDSMSFYSQGIGGFHYGIGCRDLGTDEEQYIEDNYIYELKRSMIGHRMETINLNDNKCISSKIVNMDRIPSKMYIHQFENKERLNRLVRGRRKR